MFCNVHFGAGALGLGLICPSVASAGGKVFVFNRPGAQFQERAAVIKQQGGYFLHRYRREREFVPVSLISEWEESALLKSAQFKGNMIVTTALKKDGVIAALPVIKKFLNARPPQFHTYFFAGENAIDSDFVLRELMRLGYESQENVTFVNCVVDRICNKISLEGEHVIVRAEDFGAIYYKSQDKDEFLFAKLRKSGIWKAENSIEYIVKRKKWVVNAAHLLISIIAYHQNLPSVAVYLDTNEGRNIFDGLMTELVHQFVVACHRTGEDAFSVRRDINEFAPQLTARISAFPQSFRDAITRLAGPSTILDFWDDFHRKISEHTLWYLEESRIAPFHISRATHMAISTIQRRRWIH